MVRALFLLKSNSLLLQFFLRVTSPSLMKTVPQRMLIWAVQYHLRVDYLNGSACQRPTCHYLRASVLPHAQYSWDSCHFRVRGRRRYPSPSIGLSLETCSPVTGQEISLLGIPCLCIVVNKVIKPAYSLIDLFFALGHVFNATEDSLGHPVTRLVAECVPAGWVWAPLDRDTGEKESEYQEFGALVPECSEYLLALSVICWVK